MASAPGRQGRGLKQSDFRAHCFLTLGVQHGMDVKEIQQLSMRCWWIFSECKQKPCLTLSKMILNSRLDSSPFRYVKQSQLKNDGCRKDEETLAVYLRRQAKRCLEMAKYHEGDAAENLRAMARDFIAKADKLGSVSVWLFRAERCSADGTR